MNRHIGICLTTLPLALSLGCGASSDEPNSFLGYSGFGGFVYGNAGIQVAAGSSAAGIAAGSGAAGRTVAGNATAGKSGSGAAGRKVTGGAGGRGTAGSKAGSGATGAGGILAVAGTGACDVSDPPANVKAWVDESWAAEERIGLVKGKGGWLQDSAIKGKGQINVCVRWGATSAMTVEVRDKLGKQMETWFNAWFSKLYPYDCFPYPKITAKITGFAVRPGKESLLPAGTTPIYTEQESGSTPAGEPKCPDACGFFFQDSVKWNHSFPNCKGGEAAHFDYSLWLDDSIGGGAAAVGGDWGLRMPVGDFVKSIDMTANDTVLHEMGHGFGLSDYYTWTGSRPEGGSILIVGSSMTGLPTEGDKWLVRRYWKETKALRYP